MKDTNIKIISEFLEAVQEDYEKVDEKRKREIIISLTEIMGFNFILSDKELNMLRISIQSDADLKLFKDAVQTRDDMAVLKDVQQEWTHFINWMLDAKTPFYDIVFKISVVATVDRNSVFSFNEDIGCEIFDRKAEATLWNKKFFPGDSFSNDYIEINPFDFPDTPETIELPIPPGAFKFFRLLSGIPVDALLRCPICGKIFMNTTKRKMIYCSPNCRSLNAVKKFRAKKHV